MEQNDFGSWLDNAPVVDMDSDLAFGGWLDGAPVVDNINAGSVPGGGEAPRRRAFIF